MPAWLETGDQVELQVGSVQEGSWGATMPTAGPIVPDQLPPASNPPGPSEAAPPGRTDQVVWPAGGDSVAATATSPTFDSGGSHEQLEQWQSHQPAHAGQVGCCTKQSEAAVTLPITHQCVTQSPQVSWQDGYFSEAQRSQVPLQAGQGADPGAEAFTTSIAVHSQIKSIYNGVVEETPSFGFGASMGSAQKHSNAVAFPLPPLEQARCAP